MLDDHFLLPYQLDIRPSQEFSYERAKSKLVNLRIAPVDAEGLRFLTPRDAVACDDGEDHEDLGFTSRQGKLLRLSGWIDMDNWITIGCAGAVLTFLQRKRATEYLPGDQAANLAYRVTSMEMFGLRETM